MMMFEVENVSGGNENVWESNQTKDSSHKLFSNKIKLKKTS